MTSALRHSGYMRLPIHLQIRPRSSASGGCGERLSEEAPGANEDPLLPLSLHHFMMCSIQACTEDSGRKRGTSTPRSIFPGPAV